jgi:hypothetical protein
MASWVEGASQPAPLGGLELPAAKKRRTDENVTPTPPGQQVQRFSIASLVHHQSSPPQAPAQVAKLAPLVPFVRACTPEQQLSTPSILLDLSKDLSTTMAESRSRMLSAAEIRDLLVSRSSFVERPNCGTPDWAIYKECPKQRRRAKKSDRWANSGGMRGSRDLPYNSATPYVRRRYGSVVPHGGTTKGKRYYEYTLLRTNPDGSIVEDKTCTLFHILPGPGETDRGRRFAPPAENENKELHAASFQPPQSPPAPSGTISSPIVLSMSQIPQARRINKPLPSQVVPFEQDNQAALARKATQAAVNIEAATARKQVNALKDAQTRKEALARKDLLARKEIVARQDLLRSQEHLEKMSMLTVVSALSDLLGGMGD